MHEVELVVQLHQRFRGSKKKITAKVEVAEKVVNHPRLRGPVKINQHVAAENEVHALHEEHLGIVLQIQTTERDQLFYLGAHLQPLLIDGQEIFAFEMVGGRAQRVVPVDARFGGFHGPVIEVGGNNLYRPAFEQKFTFLEHVHGQGIGLFAGGAA